MMGSYATISGLMAELSQFFGDRKELEPFPLSERYLNEIYEQDKLTGLISHGYGEENIAEYAYVRAHIPVEIDLAGYHVFRTVREAMLPGTAQGWVYIGIHFHGDLRGSMSVNYRGIPDEVVAWILNGLFGVTVRLKQP
jgi:hypothetical protein